MAVNEATRRVQPKSTRKRMMPAAFLQAQIVVAAVWVTLASLNSAVASALIAGMFGMCNVVLLFVLESRHRQHIDELTRREERLDRREQKSDERGARPDAP